MEPIGAPPLMSQEALRARLSHLCSHSPEATERNPHRRPQREEDRQLGRPFARDGRFGVIVITRKIGMYSSASQALSPGPPDRRDAPVTANAATGGSCFRRKGRGEMLLAARSWLASELLSPHMLHTETTAWGPERTQRPSPLPSPSVRLSLSVEDAVHGEIHTPNRTKAAWADTSTPCVVCQSNGRLVWIPRHSADSLPQCA